MRAVGSRSRCGPRRISGTRRPGGGSQLEESSGLGRVPCDCFAGTPIAACTDGSLGFESRPRALPSGAHAANTLYSESIDRLGRTSIRLQLARAHLLYVEWLRRERHRREAREQLRTALELFTSMGAEGFADRSERELSATGVHARKRSIETRD